MNQPSRYLIWVTGLVAAIIGAIATFNWVVDPYGIYRVIDVQGFNANKPGEHGHDRMVKAHAIARLKPDGLVLGTSRIQYGVDPDDDVLRRHAARVYNAGLLNSDIYLVLRHIQHAQATAPLRLVL